MLTSSRFTVVVTTDTHDRLLRAQDNVQPITTGEGHRGAVVAIQAALAELNSSYLAGAEIDGYFGARTARAVEAFQRDYGLVADGVVGQQVLNQLDSLYSGAVMRVPRGVSVHLGVDRVDADHYGGEMALPSCVNDANAMRDLAEDAGYDTLLLVNEGATTDQFTSFMRSCATTLFAGDSLLVTFSGHGGQIPNTSDDDEPDLLDETWCFHDRMLIDDEFYALLAGLREGVRVHVVLDSCHSGTAAKWISPAEEAERQRLLYLDNVSTNLAKTLTFVGVTRADSDELNTEMLPITSASLPRALEGERPEHVEPPLPNADLDKELASLFADLYHDVSYGEAKFLGGVQVYNRQNNKQLYDTVKTVVGATGDLHVACTVTLLAACDDSQTTPAGMPLSMFTFNVTQAWGGGAFQGSYTQFHRAVKDLSRSEVTPQINAYGSGGAEARLRERPFTF